MKNLLTSTRGASLTEYGMLLSLVSGIALIAVLSFSNDARRALEAPTAALALASLERDRVAPGTAPETPDDGETGGGVIETPTEPEPAPEPVLLGFDYAVRGAWVPIDQPAPSAGYFNAYSPAPATLRVPDRAMPTSTRSGDTIDGLTVSAVASRSLSYQDAGPSSHPASSVNALLLYSNQRPGFVFVVPNPSSAAERTAVDGGAFWRLYATQSLQPPAGAGSSYFLPSDVRSTQEPAYE